jgi:hypothetical protein
MKTTSTTIETIWPFPFLGWVVGAALILLSHHLPSRYSILRLLLHFALLYFGNGLARRAAGVLDSPLWRRAILTLGKLLGPGPSTVSHVLARYVPMVIIWLDIAISQGFFHPNAWISGAAFVGVMGMVEISPESSSFKWKSAH